MVASAEAGATGCELRPGQGQADGEQKAQCAQGRAESLREGHHPPLQGQWRTQPTLWRLQLRRLSVSCQSAAKTGCLQFWKQNVSRFEGWAALATPAQTTVAGSAFHRNSLLSSVWGISLMFFFFYFLSPNWGGCWINCDVLFSVGACPQVFRFLLSFWTFWVDVPKMNQAEKIEKIRTHGTELHCMTVLKIEN